MARITSADRLCLQRNYANSTARTSLIMGANGQDGHFLCELLSSMGRRVIGAGKERRDFAGKFLVCDITREEEVARCMKESEPDEIYNLAGISSPAACESDPALAHAVNVEGVLHLIDSLEKTAQGCRLFQASSAYIFSPSEQRMNENSPKEPDSVYGKQKLQAHRAVERARAGGIFAVNGILFNHESHLRGTEFVTRKVTNAAAGFSLGTRHEPLTMGSMDSVRDWGYAGDYVRAMQLMLEAKKPRDYVIATGVGHTVRELCETAFLRTGLDYRKFVKSDAALARRAGPDILVGDPSLIKRDLKWSAKTTFAELVGMMVDYDLTHGA